MDETEMTEAEAFEKFRSTMDALSKEDREQLVGWFDEFWTRMRELFEGK